MTRSIAGYRIQSHISSAVELHTPAEVVAEQPEVDSHDCNGEARSALRAPQRMMKSVQVPTASLVEINEENNGQGAVLPIPKPSLGFAFGRGRRVPAIYQRGMPTARMQADIGYTSDEPVAPARRAGLSELSSSFDAVSRRTMLQGAAIALPGVPLDQAAAGTYDQPGVGEVVGPTVAQTLKRLPIPGELGGEYVTMQLAVGGRQILVLVDTGFSADLLLTARAARELGAVDRGDALSVTAYRKGSQRIVRVPGMRFLSESGVVSFSAPVDALVGDFPLAMASTNLAGVIGMSSYWENFDVDLDLRGGALRLYRQGSGRKVAVQEGMVPVKASPIARFGIPALNLLTPGGDRMLALVDTGATFTIANPAAANLLGLKPQARFGEFAGFGFAEVETKEVVFEPRSLGLQLDSRTGEVIEIVPDGQAERLGVQKGWRLEGLENEVFTPARLQELMQDKSKFTVAFKEGTLESVTKLAQGVRLRVDRGGWRPFETGFTFKPDRIALGDLDDLEEFAGRGNPAVILGLDVLRNRRLIFADGDKGRRTLFLG